MPLIAALAAILVLTLFACKEDKPAATVEEVKALPATPDDAIDINKLQKKGDDYYLNNKPFTGKAKNETMGEYSGTREELEIKDGKLHGAYGFFSEDYSTTGTYKEGKKYGEWMERFPFENKKIVQYYNNDKVIKTETYENDKLVKTEIPEKTLCDANEDVLLSFKMQNSSKIMSLCVEKNSGYIVYRYGPKDKVELEYPENKTDSWSRFTHYHEYYSGGADFMMSFQNGSFTYEIRDQAFKGGERELWINVINNKTDKTTILKGEARTSEGGLGNAGNYNKLKDGGSLLAHLGVGG